MKNSKLFFFLCAFFSLTHCYAIKDEAELKILIKRFYKLIEKNEYVQPEFYSVFIKETLDETNLEFFEYQLKNGGKITEKEYLKMLKEEKFYKLLYESIYSRRQQLGLDNSFSTIEQLLNTSNRIIFTETIYGCVGELIFNKYFIITFQFEKYVNNHYEISNVLLSNGCSIFSTPDKCEDGIIKIGTVATNKESINVYQNKSKNSPITHLIFKGQQIRIKATYTDDFYKVASKHYTGFIKREDFKLIKFFDTPPF